MKRDGGLMRKNAIVVDGILNSKWNNIVILSRNKKELVFKNARRINSERFNVYCRIFSVQA